MGIHGKLMTTKFSSSNMEGVKGFAQAAKQAASASKELDSNEEAIVVEPI